MRLSLPTGLLLLVSLPALAAVATGCQGYSFWGCDAAAACEPADVAAGGAGTGGESGTGGTASGTGSAGGTGGTGGGLGCPDDPAEGAVHASCGVWVSDSSGDDVNPGTQELPVKTLGRGIELAGTGPGRLYACGETYPEAVVLPDGIDLFGGFDCLDLLDWEYIGPERKATVLAPVGLAALVLPLSPKESLIADFQVVTSDATTPGSSSMAVLALPGSRSRFRRCEVAAGHGADGADGADGSDDGQPAPKGAAGNNGSDACTQDNGVGGLAVVTLCDGADSIGAQGGDANALAANDGLDGSPAPDPNPDEHGAGGQGENAAKGTVCTGGQNGVHGQDGSTGLGGAGSGALSIDGYVGAPGSDGQPGAPAQGGGGGGAALGVCGAGPKGGAGGGSGGSGGCGGKAAKGGQAGGSSIAFAVLSKHLFAEDLLVRTSNGGKGGNGGFGQAGGQGGLPGYGGLSASGGAQNGCAGGVGGHGGHGGHGGGGRGGHSAGFVNVSGANPHSGRSLFLVGQQGPGGHGGNPGSDTGNGSPGVRSEFFTILP